MGRGGGTHLPSTSPLKTLFDSSQLSGSINVQDGGTTSFLKSWIPPQNTPALQAMLHENYFPPKISDQATLQTSLEKSPNDAFVESINKVLYVCYYTPQIET